MATDVLQALDVTLKFKRIHNALARLFGEEFKPKVKKYIDQIEWAKKEQSLETLPALLKILELPMVKESEVYTMWFVAAALEILIEEK